MHLGHTLQKCLRTQHSGIQRHNITAAHMAKRLSGMEHAVPEGPRGAPGHGTTCASYATQRSLHALHETKTAAKYMAKHFPSQMSAIAPLYKLSPCPTAEFRPHKVQKHHVTWAPFKFKSCGFTAPKLHLGYKGVP